ncbi:hypothetical protein E3N88_35928 [Mikania micrantha]|uniref:Uncharacterized protein n=1 Tax=Mikania micrantha TaxID=192012 RepID=A0A5N6M2M8_9ASTR|nr:hypothetical protein E3N88_35928 [Mikania micrantha]
MGRMEMEYEENPSELSSLHHQIVDLHADRVSTLKLQDLLVEKDSKISTLTATLSKESDDFASKIKTDHVRLQQRHEENRDLHLRNDVLSGSLQKAEVQLQKLREDLNSSIASVSTLKSKKEWLIREGIPRQATRDKGWLCYVMGGSSSDNHHIFTLHTVDLLGSAYETMGDPKLSLIDDITATASEENLDRLKDLLKSLVVSAGGNEDSSASDEAPSS